MASKSVIVSESIEQEYPADAWFLEFIFRRRFFPHAPLSPVGELWLLRSDRELNDQKHVVPKSRAAQGTENMIGRET